MASLPKNRRALRTRAFEIIREKSFEFGDFTLASGKKSIYYLDMKPTMFDPEGSNVLARLVMDRISKLNVDYIGGLEMGAVPLISAINVLSLNYRRGIPGFFVRKGVKDHGTKKLIEAPDGALAGKNVVILEDVTTEGKSAMQAVTAAKSAGANVVLVLSIVDREEGASELFKSESLPFECLFRADEFMPGK
jgi:orotate phosphoribosyltransferase